GPVNRPVHAWAISTMSAESKCARWAAGDSHFDTIVWRRGSVTDTSRSMFRQPGWPRLITTYFESTAWRAAGSAASNRMMTTISSPSSAPPGPVDDWLDTRLPPPVDDRPNLPAELGVRGVRKVAGGRS